MVVEVEKKEVEDNHDASREVEMGLAAPPPSGTGAPTLRHAVGDVVDDDGEHVKQDGNN